MCNEYFHQKKKIEQKQKQKGERNESFPENDRLPSFGEQELGLGIDGAKFVCSVGSS